MTEYKLSTAGYAYKDPNEIRELEALGFSFELAGGSYWISGRPTITLNTLSELEAFVAKHRDVVLTVKDGEAAIMIYDDYIE